MVLVARVRGPRVLARGLLGRAWTTKTRVSSHMITIRTTADELGQRELPADQHPEHQPKLPDEIRRGELERQRGARRRALWKSDFAIAIAAYEHDEEAAPSPVAQTADVRPRPARRRSIAARGTQAWTIAETAKPSTTPTTPRTP